MNKILGSKTFEISKNKCQDLDHTSLCPHPDAHFSQGNAYCIYLFFSLGSDDIKRGLILATFRSASSKYF